MWTDAATLTKELKEEEGSDDTYIDIIEGLCARALLL
jgi:hypothetical protein